MCSHIRGTTQIALPIGNRHLLKSNNFYALTQQSRKESTCLLCARVRLFSSEGISCWNCTLPTRTARRLSENDCSAVFVIAFMGEIIALVNAFVKGFSRIFSDYFSLFLAAIFARKIVSNSSTEICLLYDAKPFPSGIPSNTSGNSVLFTQTFPSRIGNE